MALAREVNKYAKDHNLLKKDESLSQDDVKEGLVCIISVKHPNPQYEGQTKTKLGNSEVRKIVSGVVGKQLQRYFLENPDDARKSLKKRWLLPRRVLRLKKRVN